MHSSDTMDRLTEGLSLTVVSGVVRNEEGDAIPDARVFFIDGPERFADVASLTDALGRFFLSAPSMGTYTIQCAAEGFVPRVLDIRVSLDDETLEIEMTR
jgi:hypothetical protein